MKSKAKLFRIYLPAYLLLTISVIVLRTIAVLKDFDKTTGYFKNKTFITIADFITIGAVIFFITYGFTAKKNMKLIPSFSTPATYIPTGVVSVAILFLGKSLIEVLVRKFKLIEKLKDSFNPDDKVTISSERLQAIILIVTLLLAVGSLVHFLVTALVEKISDAKRANFGLCTILFLCMYTVYLYFSTDLPINAPAKITDQMAVLSASVFFLYETRLSMGREKWRWYISFGFVASTVCAYSAIPSVIYYFAKSDISKGNYALLSNSIYESAFVLALFIFITARLLLTGELIEDKPSKTVSRLIELAEEREADIATQNAPEATEEGGEEEDDGNQISITIDDMPTETESVAEPEVYDAPDRQPVPLDTEENS